MAVAVRFVASFESGIEMVLFLKRDAGLGRESESESERKRETETDASRAAVRYDTLWLQPNSLTNRPMRESPTVFVVSRSWYLRAMWL